MDAVKGSSKHTPIAALLLSIRTANHENAKAKPIDLVEILSKVLVEPTYLQ